jgi:hypothetical protein
MATEWADSGRCKFSLNEKTGLHEPIIETQSLISSRKIAVLAHRDQLPADKVDILAEAEEGSTGS